MILGLVDSTSVFLATTTILQSYHFYARLQADRGGSRRRAGEELSDDDGMMTISRFPFLPDSRIAAFLCALEE